MPVLRSRRKPTQSRKDPADAPLPDLNCVARRDFRGAPGFQPAPSLTMATRPRGDGFHYQGEHTQMTSFAARSGSRAIATLLALAAVAALVAIGAPRAHAGVGVTCPDKFTVSKKASVDNTSFAAGQYTVKVKRMTCDSAKSYFDVFLDQGKTSKGWKLNGRKGKFRNKNRGLAFRVTRSGGGGGGGGGGGTTCNFQVLNNDKIDNLNVPKGNYQLTAKRMPCTGDKNPGTASYFFRQFLSAPGNKLPAGWRLNKAQQKFTNASKNVAFSIKRVGS